MRKFAVWLAALLFSTMGCGGGGNSSTPTSGVSGAYEFVVTSNVTGGTTLVEANLVANGNQSNAAGPSQAQVLTRENKIWYLNGVCAGEMPGQNTVAASLAGNNQIAVTFDQGGNSLTGQGTLTGTTISGNYSVSNSKCPDLVGIVGSPAGFDSGGFTGNPVPNLAGTFSGVLNLSNGVENAAITLMENSDRTLNVPVTLTGTADNGTFPFSGSAVGSTLFISGSVDGTVLSWLGYVDYTGRFTGTPNSVLIFDYDTLAIAGLLLKQ
jgi:hypothetical protein